MIMVGHSWDEDLMGRGHKATARVGWTRVCRLGRGRVVGGPLVGYRHRR